MRKVLFLVATLTLVYSAYAQTNSSWVDPAKVYYKFSLAKDTLCRITQAQLAAAGIATTAAQDFQLWRNGKEVRLYTSVATGPLSNTDYVEFWGEMNDGATDKALYRVPATQLCEKYSLETDTAVYFLTINSGANNLRYIQSANPVVGTTLTPDAYFMRRIENHYKNVINKGYAYDILSEYVYSSSYDVGESWSSGDVYPGSDLVKNITNLNKYAAGPANSVTFSLAASGNASNGREIIAKLFNTEVVHATMNGFSYYKDTIRNFPLSALTSNTDLTVSINGNSTTSTDRISVACFTITYPATFNFNNEKNFYFELAPNAVGNYLIINNFNNNGIAPILYDITNGRRYLGNIDVAGQVRFVLPPSADLVRKFNLMSNVSTNIYQVNTLTRKFFTNYSLPASQGDYIIISNKVLYDNGNGTNNVEAYRQYRASAAGGGYNAKVYDIDELTDQFGFGIKKDPIAVRDFILYAKQKFSVAPKYVFIIGHGLSYNDYTPRQDDPIADQLNLVQTFGWPVSDVLLAVPQGNLVEPVVPIGRLGAVNGGEVGTYLGKIKEYELIQRTAQQTIADRGWMKNFLHTVGGATPDETIDFTNYVNGYKKIAEDTFYGANVHTYVKSSTATIEQQQSAQITQLFHEGLGYIKYFGHSSANELAINLNYPETYDNAGKYPFMHVSGCTVGNFYTYNPLRVSGNYANMSLSEKYVFLDHKGSIGFLGSSHFGLADILNFYNTFQYQNMCIENYDSSIGQQIQKTVQTIGSDPNMLYQYRLHLEEINLHGDPALKLNVSPKPDYVIEDQLVKFTPNIISVADNNYTVDIKMMNIGKAVKDSIHVTVKQKLPNNSIRPILDTLIPGIRYMDSIHRVIHIDPITDKGRNELIVTVDEGNAVNEMSETNNTLVKEFYIFEDELRPISPYNFSIVNNQNISFYGSTANPLSTQRQYVMEVDTTELFNSPFKKSYNTSGVGGVIQFSPANLTFTENNVYYWRTATVPLGTASYIWNTSSFIYLSTGGPGYNQSHYYQHVKSSTTYITYTANRDWKFNTYVSGIKVKSGVFPTAAHEASDFEVDIDGDNNIQSACGVYKIIINKINPVGMVPRFNGNGLENSETGPCVANGREWNYQYDLTLPASRVAAANCLRNTPAGYYVVVRNIDYYIANPVTFSSQWKLDGAINLYDELKNIGFTDIDSLNRARVFSLVYRKGDNTFTPKWIFSDGIYDKTVLDVNCDAQKANGTITSPLFGPAKAWNKFYWKGRTQEPTAGDSISYHVIGVDAGGLETPLFVVDSTIKDYDISSVDAKQYPYIKLQMFNQDKTTGTPYQLDYWRLNYTPLPEGAVAPNILYAMKDTVEQGEKIDFKLAFKNISPTAFDSLMRIDLIIKDQNNLNHPLPVAKGKKLIAGDTLVISYSIDTRGLPGNNTLFVEVNPAGDQAEQFHFNNILYKNFFVKADVYDPLLDVTFDGIHILNNDIVAGKPHILIDLKDESKYMALADTSLIKVQVRFPDGTLHDYHFDNNMQFTPANLATGNNTAKIDFTPTFITAGEYELIVSGKDVVGNTAGTLSYQVTFNVISKPMISNLLNYPNPFTTSTAFVFTVTGMEVPQNIRIQVLTITGKIVREITKAELGPIHIGNNITEFKWDGTDMYGQKLANGVYIYRVLTNLNGQSLDKYTGQNNQGSTVTDGINSTDKYFNKGYGKMVILR